MANEFRHGSVGTDLSQAEWESITGHSFDAQATGDLMYASSATQLSRLAIAAVNSVLTSTGSAPSWSTTLAGLTLTTPTIADLTNATHNHSNNAGGGSSLSSPTITTPTISGTGFTNATHAHAAANSGGQVAHTSLTSVGVNDHHNESHTVASHSDTTATGTELETLTDGSDADSLHTHGASAQIYTGTYTGDGATSQGVTGVGFQPKYVLITQRQTSDGANFQDKGVIWTTDVIVDDNASGYAINQAQASTPTKGHINAIISLDADGFTVDDNGGDTHPNQNTAVYNFLAIG